MTIYLEVPGTPVQPHELQIAKAQDLLQILRSKRLAYSTYIESRQETDGVEVVVVDVEVERGQRTVHDIRAIERVAVRFFPNDDRIPEALALRKDFPVVPHLNLRLQALPRSLCLYEETYDELKLSWTAAGFVERLRTWLALTARGELHGEDQPLEPLIMGSAEWLILPPEFYDASLAERPQRMFVRAIATSTGRYTYLASVEDKQKQDGVACIATVIVGDPQPHGVIRQQPATLKQLDPYMTEVGVDLIAVLRERLREWQHTGEAQQLLEHCLILILILPKTRAGSGNVEASDVYAFVGAKVLGFIGEYLGVWQQHDGKLGAVLGTPAIEAEKVSLAMLNPTPAFSPARAALFAGRADAEPVRITSIGAGALGSQVIMQLLRMGYVPWTVIDKDILLPHNLGRHALDGWAVGHAKADTLAASARLTLNDNSVVTPLVADVLHPGPKAAEVMQALTDTNIILDMSASVPVARSLASDVTASARRISLFLNPNGEDLVLLAEDAARSIPLDLLEMQYYRFLIQEPALHKHLAAPVGGHRYARSCGDVSATIPPDLVALHAAIGTRVLSKVFNDVSAHLKLWHVDPSTVEVTTHIVTPSPVVKSEVNGWSIYTDTWLVAQLHVQRNERLPNETGGVLLGNIDLQRQRMYVVLSIPSPPDSVEWPNSYIRGCQGLAERVQEIDEITGGQLTYVGEWHSHPQGHNCTPSTTDRQAMGQLAKARAADSLPALMGIVSDNQQDWFVREV